MKPGPNYDDFSSLLATLISVDTFTLGFALTFIGSLFSYDDLLAMDQRFASQWSSLDHNYMGGGASSSEIYLPSTSFASRGWSAIEFLSAALFIGIGMYTAIPFFKHDDRYLTVFKVATALAYVCFMIGFVFFYACTAIAAYARFPKYCNTQASGWALGQVWGSASLYDSSSQKMNQGCITSSIAMQGGDPVTALNVINPILFCSGFILCWAYYYTFLAGKEAISKNVSENQEVTSPGSFPL